MDAGDMYWISAASLAAATIAAYVSASREMRRMQSRAIEAEGDFLEEVTKIRSSMPPPGSLHPLVADVIHAQMELERKKEVLRISSIPPHMLPRGSVPPPPPEVWAELTKPLPVVVPPPPRLPKV